MDNGSIESSTLDFGNAGSIVVNVGTFSLSGGARIDSGTSGPGHGGAISIQGFGGPDTRVDAVMISGTDSAGQPSGLFTNAGSAGGFSNASADGAGGDIRVFANTITLESGGTISAVSSSTSALAQGGSIVVDANQVVLSTSSTITSASTVTGGEAPGGSVEISAQTMTLDSGASVSASTAGGGNAGGVTASVGTLSLTGGAQITSASTGTASGSAGSVTIQGLASPADAVTLTNSSLRTSADSKGRGGSITVDATNLTLNGATISASVKDVNAADVTDGPTFRHRQHCADLVHHKHDGRHGHGRNQRRAQRRRHHHQRWYAHLGQQRGNIQQQPRLRPAGMPGRDHRGARMALGTSTDLCGPQQQLTVDELPKGLGLEATFGIHAGQVQLAALALLTADTIGTGKAGSIEVTSDNLSVTGGARIQASTAGAGNAGDITITNSDTVSITGLSSDGSTRSGIFAKTQSSGGITVAVGVVADQAGGRSSAGGAVKPPRPATPAISS